MGKVEDTSSLSVGYSKSGMEGLDKSLKEMLVDKIDAALDQLYKEIDNNLSTCWAGASKKAYMTDFKARIQDTKNEIDAEYKDLQERFKDVTKFFSDQDEDLYTSVNSK